ncbi:MAG: DNA polymerase I [Bacilli bacterium]|jgi:DNA polymerase-1
MANKKTITLIDGNSLMFRSYYATAYRGIFMQTKNGLYTNALYGFCNMFISLIEDLDYAFVAFDAGKQTFRHQEFTEYKAKRKELPEELRVQIPYIKKYLDIMKIYRDESLDYEADDLIACVANKMYNDFDEIRIITGDKDLLQLVNDKISVYLTKKGVGELDEYNKENFYEKAGFHPEQTVDFKGLVGDASDNLPGIKGIGEKTALKLLNEYPTLEDMIANADKITGKTGQLIKENQEIGLKCKYLATLKCDIDIDVTPEDFKVEEYDYQELVSFFQEMEFNSFLKRLPQKKSKQPFIKPDIIKGDSKLGLNEDAYLVVEVFGENYFRGEFLGLSLITETKRFFFTKEAVLSNQELKAYLKEPQYLKKTFDYKKLCLVLKRHGLELKGVSFDLMLAAYLLNPAFGSDDIKIAADNFSTNDLPYYENIYGANKKMAIPTLDVYAKYSVQKCEIIKELENGIWDTLKEQDLLSLYEIEQELSEVLAEMELNGLPVNLKHLENIGAELSAKADAIAAEIYQIAGEEFNINSPKQLGEILFDKLHLPHGKRTKTGFSTSVDVLEKLAADYKIARLVLDYRGYNKLVTTYVNGLKDAVDEKSYLHPLYKQALTQTGRLSSVEPNIQNIPVRTEEGQMIREIFISRFSDGYIITADYSQIELRILAHLSGDAKMIEAFNQAVDFHKQTASLIYEVDPETVTKEMRHTAKAINFGIIYGMSAWGLSESLGISPLEANIYINKYFDTYREVKRFLDETVARAKEDGYTKTVLNRRRYIPEINNPNKNLSNFGERTAMNAPMQGSASDIIKIAMVNIKRRINKAGLKALLIAQVHDELVFDCPKEEVNILKDLVKEEMESAFPLKVKLLVEVGIGKNWAEAK